VKGETEILKKTIAGIIITLIIVAAYVCTIPVQAQRPTIKIGIVGPFGLPHWSPCGMKEGAEIARDEINVAGVNVEGTLYDIELMFADEHSHPVPDPEMARLEIETLIEVEEVKFIVGGFRTEVTGPMIEKVMDYQIPFIINGAADNELIDCGDGTCGTCVRCNYERYKYLFRMMPSNETTLLISLITFLQGHLIPERLLPLYGEYLWPGAPNPQVRVAVIAEDLQWTEQIYVCLTNPAYYPFFLGPYANVTYSARVDPNTNAPAFIPYLTAIDASEARLIVHLFSGPAGVDFIVQWGNMGVEAVPVGINAMSQMEQMWSLTVGKCENEAFLAASGTGTPIVPGVTAAFWGNFTLYTAGKWPMYTAFGAYDAIYTLKEAIERAGTTDADAVVAELEQTDRTSTLGNFKFTEYHDVFVNEMGPTWTQGFVRPLVVQWQDGVLEVVWPQDQVYSKPAWPMVYPKEDLNQDGKVDFDDVTIMAGRYGTYPGHEGWDPAVDIMKDDFIDWFDMCMVERMFGWEYPEEPSAQAVEWNLSIRFKKVNYDVTVFSNYIVYSNYTFDWMEISSSRLVGYFEGRWRVIERDESWEGQISFDVTSEIDGFCNVTIPKELMFGDFTVLLDDVATPFILTETEDYTFIYFESTQLSFNVKIIGETEPRLPGDINGDGIVDIYDAIILAGHFGREN
jgi:branched-chain amino acid transport system substrate-binding protein